MSAIATTCADWHDAAEHINNQLLLAHTLRLRGESRQASAIRIHRATFVPLQVILFCRVMAAGWDAANDPSARAA